MKNLFYVLPLIILQNFSPAKAQTPTLNIVRTFCESTEEKPLILFKGNTFVQNQWCDTLWIIGKVRMNQLATLAYQYKTGRLPQDTLLSLCRAANMECSQRLTEMKTEVDQQNNTVLPGIRNSIDRLEQVQTALNTTQDELAQAQIDLNKASKKIRQANRNYWWTHTLGWVSAAGVGILIGVLTK